MKISHVSKAILVIAWLIIVFVGAGTLFTPEILQASSGITRMSAPSLLNEIRASGGALLVCGMLIVAGAFVAQLTFSALLMSTMLYLSYGASRLYSIIIDGMPDETLIQAFAIEIVVGLASLFVFIGYLKKRTKGLIL